MNVAFVSNVVYPFVQGGAEKRIHEIGSRLADRGHSVTVYARHFWDGPRETTHEGMQLRAVADDHPLYTDEGRRSIREAIDFGARSYRPLSRGLADHDVLVASVFPYFPVLAAVGACLRRDVPIVTTWHECWKEYWWEYLGWLAVGGILVERLVASVPQHPVAVSPVTADRLAELGVDREEITVVPNGVDVSRVAQVEPVADPAPIVFVGRLVKSKRVVRLLEAVASLEGDPGLTVVGDGPERDALVDEARSLGIAERVTFTGFLDSHEEVLGHLRGADVFATASIREGFGIAIVEAMAAGCHVVATDHRDSAASEVVDGAGFLAEPTAASLATQIQRVLDGERPLVDPRQRALTYDWDAVTDRALETYRRAADVE